MYDVILADPPWDFEVWNRDTGSGRSASAHYNTMTIKDICALPIKELSAENCALFLWVVWPSMLDRYDEKGRLIAESYPNQVLRAWGFRYVTKAFTWVKARRSGFGFHFGMGYYTRANDEACILAVRGKMPVESHDVSTVIYAPIREHSRKPDEQYQKIERLYPNMRCLELFARRRRKEWDVFGNQVEGSIELPSLQTAEGL